MSKLGLTLRFTPEQHASLKAAAEREGRSLSNYILNAALKAANPQLTATESKETKSMNYHIITDLNGGRYILYPEGTRPRSVGEPGVFTSEDKESLVAYAAHRGFNVVPAPMPESPEPEYVEDRADLDQ